MGRSKPTDKRLCVLRYMPPLHHKLPGKDFDIRSSEVINWLIRNPNVLGYEPLRPVDVMPVNCIKIQYNGEKKFPTIEEFAREAKDQAIKIIEEETGVSFDRLVQLACADQEGRCTIFPRHNWLDLVFGEQEVFYGIDMDYMENPIREITVRSDERITWYGDYTTIVLRGRDENGYEREFLPEEVGKTVFRTREEAESALKARE